MSIDILNMSLSTNNEELVTKEGMLRRRKGLTLIGSLKYYSYIKNLCKYEVCSYRYVVHTYMDHSTLY